MKEIFDYLEAHKMTAIIFVVGLLVMFGLVIRMNPAPVATPVAGASPLQLAALQTGGTSLPMGVVLEGKGTVISVEPGSPAERAGIQPGDLINRINGR